MSPRSYEILRLLADGKPRSGEAIAAAVGISRAAVWKILHTLDTELDLGIESVRGQGYHLPEPMELLSLDAIRAQLDAETEQSIRRLEILAEIDSTNAYLLERGRRDMHFVADADAGFSAGPHFSTGEICLAERQSAGRGRLGRHWVSPFGRNIYLSILWRYPLAPAQLGGLSLACGLAVAQALDGLGVDGVGLKWPNDIHWQRRKLAGLLLEVAGEAQGPSLVVVGVGLNLRLRAQEAARIDQPWVDLRAICGDRAPGRNALTAALIEGLIATLSRYTDAGLAPFLEDWRRFDAYPGEQATLLAGQHRILGRYGGIDAQGNLLLETDTGRRTFASGEVSLRAMGSSTRLRTLKAGP
ncbi:MAG: bifunctional biotin--[acetyl-CoA-carboxylase] ligase/biotin operon repressor BirA [Lamprobacter sp.]|uniref:bifunctional biotin--[acetyl-CoA-carboxylase] ligase/biotin operon repressor BirA n=1 Tax=Lamprobacter sp. TaxID=3100796 RepID=UPI002B2579F1|nr:bifunctional biotin--[acetyl-CoA-carboxylase] ligase/biotin operon repressor BirA [Lamprobacter sp.]MEA3638544.1 bifunctional biotin--[acetyl-CoA-carboxylase] ligase/biotin operon repressor BirA [Lamprobacter sp.]